MGYLAVTFAAAGGTAPYTWSVASGTFPPGLTLSGGGVITGTNTNAGQYPFTVKVTDSAGLTATGSTKIGVFPALAVSQPCAQVCSVGVGCTTCGRFGSVSGGAGPYHYKVVGGTIPSGMTLSGFALSGPWPAPTFINQPVDVLGPPITRIIYALNVSVTDDFGVTKTVAANWLEFGPIFMGGCATDTQCGGCGTASCTDSSITYSGGNPSDAVTVQINKVCDATGACVTGSSVSTMLPPSFSATANNGSVTFSYDCANTCSTFYADIYFVVVDHGACVAPAYVSSQETIFNIDF